MESVSSGALVGQRMVYTTPKKIPLHTKIACESNRRKKPQDDPL